MAGWGGGWGVGGGAYFRQSRIVEIRKNTVK